MRVPGSAHPWPMRRVPPPGFQLSVTRCKKCRIQAASGTAARKIRRQCGSAIRSFGPAAPAEFGWGQPPGPKTSLGTLRGPLNLGSAYLSSVFVRTPPCQLPFANSRQASTTLEILNIWIFECRQAQAVQVAPVRFHSITPIPTTSYHKPPPKWPPS